MRRAVTGSIAGPQAVTTGRSFDRLVNFTDAIVAVAITLLVLSLVDIRGSSDEPTVWKTIYDHSSEVIAFVLTFFVVAVMWRVHNRVFNDLRGYDTTIYRLNLLWLLGIVLLPWPSALYGEGFTGTQVEWSGGQGLGGAGMFYWGTMAWISLMSTLISRHVRSHPELLEPDAVRAFRHPLRGVSFTVLSLLMGVTSLFAPILASWMLLLLIPLSIVLDRAERRVNAENAQADGAGASPA